MMRPLVPLLLLSFCLFWLASGGVATAHIVTIDQAACTVEGYLSPSGVTSSAPAQTLRYGSMSSNQLASNGTLRVVSSFPIAPTTVFVNNTRRGDGGLNSTRLPPGTYTIHFTDVPGFATPANQTVTVNAGLTTTVTGNFQQLGVLHVTTNPAVAATISIDGKVRDDREVLLPLTPGQHTVHFGDVANYTSPADQQVTVVAGSTVTVAGNYMSGVNPGPTGFGYLHVTTNPAVVSTIYVDDTAMDDTGVWVKLAPGTYAIHFSDVPGYASPSDQTVTVAASATANVTGTFMQLGHLHVTTNPLVSGAIYVNGTAMDDRGVWLTLQPGTYTVSFGDAPSKVRPSPQIVTVAPGSTTTIIGQYSQKASSAPVAFGLAGMLLAVAMILGFSAFVVYRVEKREKRRAGPIRSISPVTPTTAQTPKVETQASIPSIPPTKLATVPTRSAEMRPLEEKYRVDKEAAGLKDLLNRLTEISQEKYGQSLEAMEVLHKIRDQLNQMIGQPEKTQTSKSDLRTANLMPQLQKLEGTQVTARTQITKGRRRSSSALIGYGLAGFGGLSLILSVIFTSTVMAFIGLGLTFWGALLLFIRPRRYVRSDLMDSTALSSLAAIDRVITNLGYTQKGVYIPVSNPQKAVVFIPSQPLKNMPKMEQVEGQTFVKDPDGIAMVPPGLSLANLFERELGVKFSEWSLQEMQERLPKLLVEDLEMVQECTIKVDGDHVSFRFVESVYSEFCSKLRSSTNVCSSLGCPMCSAMACVLAEVSHRPVEFDKDKYSTDGGTVESSYLLLPG